MKYIFIDTFAIEQLTKECYDALSFYLWEQKLQLLITPMLLVEYFSPMLQRHDRTERAVLLLLENDFVIANQGALMQEEEDMYPAEVSMLPVAWRSDSSLENLNDHDQFQLFYGLLHHGLPGTGYDLKSWAEKHNSEKLDWELHVNSILTNAKKKGTIHNKSVFIESLDLRLCEGLRQTLSDLNKPEKHDTLFFERIEKLYRIKERHDTVLMKGIHLSSLITWYDYVIAKKKIKPSDEADILHAMFYPYCKVVIADASRVDCIRRIQREDHLYKDINIYTKKEFKNLLLGNYPEIPDNNI